MKFLVALLFSLAAADAAGYAYNTHVQHPGLYNGLYKTALAQPLVYSSAYKTGYLPAYYQYAPVNNFKYAFSTPHDGVVAYQTNVAAPVVKTVTHHATPLVQTVAHAAPVVHHAAAPIVKTVVEAAPAAVVNTAQVYAPAYAKSQYHEQNQLGEYKFGYVGDTSAREEVRDANGVVTGHYSYLDSNNIPQKVHYVADAAGFRVAATNLPVDANTPVAAAHVAVAPVAVAKSLAAPVAIVGDAINPHVPYTAEVAQARAEHFAAVNDAAVATGAHIIAKRSAEPFGYGLKKIVKKFKYGGGYGGGYKKFYGGGYKKGYGGGYKKFYKY